MKEKHMFEYILIGAVTAVLLPACVLEAELPDESEEQTSQIRAEPAGGSCTLGCSETHNTSGFSVLAGRNWPDVYGQTLWVAPGGKTPQKQDWDAFRVDAGWCYRVQWYIWGVPGSTTNYNQIGQGEVWIQVHNNETAVVQRQSTSSC